MITVLFGGSRPDGNTAQLTKYALQGLEYNWIDLTTYQLNQLEMLDMIREKSLLILMIIKHLLTKC